MTFYGWDIPPDVVYLYSASGVFLRKVNSTMQKMGILRNLPDAVFDSNDTTAQTCIESWEGWFSFGRNVQPQDIGVAYEHHFGVSDGRDFSWNNAGKERRKKK